MSDSNLSVKITADIVDLQTKFAVAKATVGGLTSEVNKLAKASAAGTIDAAGQQRLQQFAGDLLAAKQQASGYAGELEKAGFSVASFGQKMEGGHGSIATATREFRALFDELSSGRTRMTPGTLAIIAQRVLGLGPAALGAVAGVGALVGGLAYLSVKAIEASRALDQAFLGAQFAGNLEITREQLKQFTDEMSQAKNISASDAQQIVASLATIPGITTPIFHALTAEVSDFARVTGKEGPKAAEELAKAFSAKASAAEFARSIGGVTQAQINMAEQADRSGDAVKAQEAKFSLLLTTLGRSTATIDEYNNGIMSSIGNFLGYTNALASGTSAEEIQVDILTQSNIQRQKQLDVLRQTAKELSGTKQTPEQDLKAGIGVADKENPVAKQITDTTTKIRVMETALQSATDPGNIELLNSALTKTREELSNLQFGPILERMREQIAQVAVTWDGSQSGMLAKQIQIGQATLADVSKNAKERLAVETEVARLEIEQRKAVGSEVIAQARAQAAAAAGDTSTGPIQRLQAERQVWAEVLAGDRVTATQRVEVARELNQTVAQIAKESAAQSEAIARSDASTDIAIAKLTIDARRSALDAEVAAGQMAASQKLAILRQLTAEEFSLNEKELEAELKALNEGTAEYARAYNQIRELKAKLVTDLAKLDQENAADAKREAAQEVTSRKLATSEILNAEGMLVNDVLGKRKSMGASIVQIAQQFALQEITNDIKAMTARLLISNTEEARKKALEQGGLLYHSLVETQKTTASVSGQAAQTAAQVSGDASRLSSQASAAVASKTLSASTGAAQVQADAAKAAAGAYSAVSAIPIVGPYIAPAAAAVAYTAVMGFESLASLDTGTNRVPQDMVAKIHKDEAIVPKRYNPAAGGQARGGGGGMVVNMGPSMSSRDVQRSLRQDGALHKTLRDMHRRGIRG